MNNSEIWTPDVIMLGPGGAKGYLELGFLLKLEQERYYITVTEWIGCSIGSIIALLIVAGYTVTEILNDCMDIKIINDISDINLEHITEKPGLLNIKSVENIIRRRIIQRFGIVPTMEQLYMATGMDLTFVTFNLDKMNPEYLNRETEPNLSCITGAMMSAAIPAIICPRIYRGYVYVDGAIGDPYPILYKDDGTKKILGVYIDSEYSTQSCDKNIGTYLYRCIQASMKMLRDRSINSSSSNCKHISLKTPIIDSTGLSLDTASKRAMIEKGYKTGCIFLNKMKNPDKYDIILDEDEEIPIEEDVTSQGVLDDDTLIMLNMLYEDTENFAGDEDVFLSDLSSGSIEDISEDDNTLLIPITPEIRMNLERVRRDGK